MTETPISKTFAAMNEPYAAGLFEEPEKGYFYRHCCGLARWFETVSPVPYDKGEKLYPGKRKYFDCVMNAYAVRPQYCTTYSVDWDRFDEMRQTPEQTEAIAELRKFHDVSSRPFGWMHGSPNYARIVKEGLDSYRDRMAARVSANAEEEDFKKGVLRLLDAMKNYAGRCLAYLKSVGAPAELTEALEQVPFRPARTYYEGLAAWNAIFYFDTCDNLGCLDRGLVHLYNGEDLTDVIAELFANMDAVDMWSCAIGPECSEVTRQALRAIKGRRRPLLELRVDENTPPDVWELAAQNNAIGGANPSFYNDKGIHDMLHDRFPYIPDEDLARFCGGGCTETNLEGLTKAGGTDLDVNLTKVFKHYLTENLAEKPDFASFFEGMCRAAEDETSAALDKIEEMYRYMSEYVPNPMRTVLFDDCIDKAKDFNAGGARYSWTMNSESGLINVIDSLAAVKKLYYDDKKYSAEEFLRLLDEEDEAFFADLRSCPCYGTDDEFTDRTGAEFARRVFSVYREKKPTLSFLDGFTLTEHQFLRYEGCGACVGATPDGRHAGQPTCDSVAAIRGKAIKGPTAMLRSAARLPQNLVDGISVLNLTLSKTACENPVLLRGLILGYFNMGGIQVQITVTSPEVLKDAMIHPEAHEDLIVRVGGYSEYFNRLSPALKQTVLERNIHDLC